MAGVAKMVGIAKMAGIAKMVRAAKMFGIAKMADVAKSVVEPDGRSGSGCSIQPSVDPASKPNQS